MPIKTLKAIQINKYTMNKKSKTLKINAGELLTVFVVGAVLIFGALSMVSVLSIPVLMAIGFLKLIFNL